MIYIKKGLSPESFENWKRTNRQREFSALRGRPKTDLRNSLISEQKGLCCYCCARISGENSHIEHIKPKGDRNWRNLRFSYKNLLASCDGFDEYGFTCGHNKDEWYNEELFVSPLEEDCESYFTYSLDGRILGASYDDKKACETISRLYINSYELITARKAVIDSILEDQSIQMNLEAELEWYKTPDDNGQLEPFYNVIMFTLEYLLSQDAGT